MNHAAMDISALSKGAFHFTSVINQKGTLLLTQKVTADHRKTHKIKHSFTSPETLALFIIIW